MLAGEWLLVIISVGSLVMSGWVFWWVKEEAEMIRELVRGANRRIDTQGKRNQENATDISETGRRVGMLEDSLQGSIGEIWSTVISATGVGELQEQVNELEVNVYDRGVLESIWEQTEDKREYEAKKSESEEMLSVLREESPVHSNKKAEY